MTSDRSRPERDHDPDAAPLDHAFQALRRGRPVPPELELTDVQRQLVDDLAPWLNHLETAALDELTEENSVPEASPPVQHDDPVALMLGLVPDPDISLDGQKLTNARKKANINLAQLCDRLNQRGWNIRVKHAFQWERSAFPLAPALIDAIADELGVDRKTLLSQKAYRQPSDDLFDDARVHAFLARWAEEEQVSVDFLRERTSKTLAAAVYRNRSTGSADALLGVLGILKEIPNFLDPNAS
jgi:transcriptional regulator with XRE-family HTH domain